MTTRERHLAVALVGILGTAAVGFLGYTFILSPLVEKNKLIKVKQTEIDQVTEDIQQIQGEKRKYEAMRQQSLPNDPLQGAGLAREDYGRLLEALCRKANLDSGLKIQVAEPDSKSVPMLGPKKPAYTRLTWDVTAKGDEYHVIDFLQHFYSQPLLHSIKTITLQRPSDLKSQQKRELDVTIKVEALVLDNAPVRSTLLPVVPEIALLVGPAAYTGYNLHAVWKGVGSPMAPAGVLADPAREYLAIAGKNVFFGPTKVKKDDPDLGPDEDLSPFIVLTSIVGHDDDGGFVAMFRDLSTNNDFTIAQDAKGAIAVKGEWELTGKRRLMPGYSEKNPGNTLLYGSDDTGNLRTWRVRRVTASEVILEKLDKKDAEEKPKPPAMSFLGGAGAAFAAVPEGKVYSVALGQCLDVNAKERDGKPPPHAAPTKYRVAGEAWKAIYAPPATASVSAQVEDKRR